MSNTFELGPIRPPSEAYSILIRVTRNCPWNKCAFCHTYKGQKFSRRPIDDIIADINAIHTIAHRILDVADSTITLHTLQKAKGNDDTPLYYYEQVAFWLNYGMKSVFLQDANSLVLSAKDLCTILTHIKNCFPTVERITSYARASTISKKTLDDLKSIRQAGLTRLHIGMESGSDTVLQRVNKGTTHADLIDAGQKAMEAGFDVSYYYMPGLGGKEYMQENAIQSAIVINNVNPTFIRLRSTVPIPGTPLYDMMEKGTWTPLSEIEKVHEIRLFIEHCDNITTTLTSDHMMNLLEDVEGTFPYDKARMLSKIDEFLSLPQEDKEKFIIGRRVGIYRYLSDYYPNFKIDQLYYSIKNQYGSVDKAVMEILKNFI
ncbi:MAG: radical SAM protein [Spirochaetes bacterium]|nr:radical SAM protein [Spirochaetota bacterium]